MTEKPCFYSKPKSYREKGCKKLAVFRVIFGDGFFVDVCSEHVEGYKGMGYKIVKLKEVEVST